MINFPGESVTTGRKWLSRVSDRREDKDKDIHHDQNQF